MTPADRQKLQAIADFIVEVAADPERNIAHFKAAGQAAAAIGEILEAAIKSSNDLHHLLLVVNASKEQGGPDA
jgi:hypothetical protein